VPRFKLFVFCLALLSAPASAQITSGPTGPFAMVDADGDPMGAALGGPPWIVSLRTPQGPGFVQLNASLDDFQQTKVYYTGFGCSGAAYIVPDPGFVLDDEPAMAVDGFGFLRVQTGPPADVLLASTQVPGGLCGSTSFTLNVVPVANAGRPLDVFTPPFRIVTVASAQAASVPTLERVSQWLIAGALVAAFALYDRRRRPLRA
jgi:hypothetical protein